jgi:hypothetical protein
MDPRHLGAAKTFEEIKSKDINEASLDAVTRLATSIMGNEKSRGQFAMENKMHRVLRWKRLERSTLSTQQLHSILVLMKGSLTT